MEPEAEHQDQSPDWLYLPPDASCVSLWEALHDGEVKSITSDLLECTVTLTIRVGHLSDSVFELKLNHVTSVRAAVLVRWPGGCDEPEESSQEARAFAIAEYWSKWREESIEWARLEHEVKNGLFEIQNAELATGRSGHSLKLTGMLDGDEFDDIYCEAYIRFGSVVVSNTHDGEIGLEGLMKLGKAYWTAFSNRAKKRMSEAEVH